MKYLHVIDKDRCKGCGLCASSCPQQAIDMLHFRSRQIVASVCAV